MKHSPSQTDEKQVFPKDRTAYFLEKHLEMFNAISLLGQVNIMFLHIILCYMSAMQVPYKEQSNTHVKQKNTSIFNMNWLLDVTIKIYNKPCN